MLLIKSSLKPMLFMIPDCCAVVWRYTSPFKGEVVDVRIAHRYIVFARSFLWKRGRLIGLLFSAACWSISGKLSQSQHNDFESFASSQCRDCSHRDGSPSVHDIKPTAVVSRRGSTILLSTLGSGGRLGAIMGGMTAGSYRVAFLESSCWGAAQNSSLYSIYTFLTLRLGDSSSLSSFSNHPKNPH